MSAVHHYWLRCDSCGDYFKPDPPVDRVGPLRSLAGIQGWVFKQVPDENGTPYGRDYCAHCKTATIRALGKKFGLHAPHEDPVDGTRGAPVTIQDEDARYVAALLRALLHNNELAHADLAERALRQLDKRSG